VLASETGKVFQSLGEAKIMSDWLVRRLFTMHSGATADFKIECAALTDEEIETFALLISKRFKFGSVFGVPSGGNRIAGALRQYLSAIGPCLVVDDVLTTGASINQFHRHSSDIGVVLFARGPCPEWVHAIFQLWHEA
jgi:hypothetical protein